MRLFVQPKLAYALSALLVSFLGAVAISAAVFANSSVPLQAALIWPGLVGIANAMTMGFNAIHARQQIVDERLPRLTRVKSLCNMLQGLAWGSGVALLNVPGEPVTVVAPAWAMVTGVGVLVFSSAPWPPSTFTFITALFLPALVFLLSQPEALEFMIGVTMAVCFPFCLLIGRLGGRYVGDLVEARLAVKALLDRESRLSARMKQLNDERTRFFSAASHDLRQPLQALSFYTNLIGRSTSTDEQRDLLGRLADCAETLDRHFNAILGVAAADAATEKAIPVPTALEPIIRQAVAGHMAQAEAKDLRLRFVPTRAVAVVAPEALERIIFNLVGNAVRYTHTGGIVVGVRRRGNSFALTVADSGIGIADEHKERIFEDFFQVANPERSRAAGFGLGLAIVARLSEGFGWPITLSSRPGHGSIFSVKVPRASAAHVAAAPVDHLDEPAKPVSLSPVLVLDDDPLVREATARLLRSWHVEHRLCACPKELMASLEAIAGQSWCILMDQRLQDGVTGLEVVDAVRRRWGNAHTCVLLTGEADPALDEAARARGLTLLRKPLKPIRLRATLSGLAISQAQ
jgi:signal transduction histidine kinase/CheY-like chemotaxis protein